MPHLRCMLQTTPVAKCGTPDGLPAALFRLRCKALARTSANSARWSIGSAPATASW
jgi:hypothetical protein